MNNKATGLPQLEKFLLTPIETMAISEMSALFFLFSALLRSSLVHSQGLQIGFYDNNCPDAEDIVRSTVEKYYNNDATIAPGLLRLHFHDCFVQVSFLHPYSVNLDLMFLCLTFVSTCFVGMWCVSFDFRCILWEDCTTEFWYQGVWSDRWC